MIFTHLEGHSFSLQLYSPYNPSKKLVLGKVKFVLHIQTYRIQLINKDEQHCSIIVKMIFLTSLFTSQTTVKNKIQVNSTLFVKVTKQIHIPYRHPLLSSRVSQWAHLRFWIKGLFIEEPFLSVLQKLFSYLELFHQNASYQPNSL